MVILTIVGMTLVVILIVGYPVITKRRGAILANDSDDLDHRKRAVYRDIKDLEFDLDMGKVSEADYRAMRADYETQAVAVLKAQDKVKVKNGWQKQQGKTGVSHNTPGLYCPACGHSVGAHDRFCGVCGQALGPMD